MEVNRLLGDWLRKQAAAEAENIAAWGGDDYARAVALSRECDRLLGEKQFLKAQASCQQAIELLKKLTESKETLLDDALRAGFSALENSDPQAAGYFQKALALDADNRSAVKGLRRAEGLPEVLRLVEAGEAKEQAGDASGALKSFSEAASLDPEFRPAWDGVSRVREGIADTRFRQAMGRALQAISSGDLAAAETALQQAQAIKGDSRAVRDLKKRLAQAQLAGNLDKLRRDAENHQKNERWQQALNSCEQALALDSRASFATTCKSGVSLRLDLDRHLQSILSRPQRLYEDGPLKEARKVLAHASRITPRGPLLESQVDQLTRLISQAEVEVEVVLLSDGLTNVVIYHVGRLGLFHEKTLVLRTGDYTAVGSRNGFRDVRQTLKVRPDSGSMIFTLRCEEPI